MEAYLELNGISKLFGDFVANDKIDLSVENAPPAEREICAGLCVF